jgi:hypothetical protein
MKKTFKVLAIGSLPLFLFVIIMSSIDIIKTDFKYAHQSFATHQDPFNWLSYKVKTGITKSFINFRKNNKMGLPIKNIYIKEALQKELLRDTPSSTKIWKKGLFSDDNGFTDKIKIKLRGDNPTNWLFLKKNWKIKKRKENRSTRQRYYEYHPFDFEVFFSGKLAKSLGLITPDLSLVELFINDKSEGIYTETETLNENFLRRKKIMPVNIYKGEQILAESIIGIENNLLNSPGALKKIAFFNQVERDDKTDLKFLSTTLQLAHNRKKNFLNLIELIDLDYWSKFMSYQILTQNFHNDYSHNFRMISDPWSGKFTPIVYDPLFNINPINTMIDYDQSSNELFVLLNQYSNFQDLKYKNLNFILNSNIIKNELMNIKFIDNKISISEGRDAELLSNNLSLITLFTKIFTNENKSNIIHLKKKFFIKKLSIHTDNIKKFLKKKPEASWYKSKKGFEIHIKGKLPISELNLFFDKGAPNWVVLDINENGKIDLGENTFKLDSNKKILIPLRFYANRIPYANNTRDLAFPKLKILPTRFKFISEKQIMPNKIEFINAFSKKKFRLKYKNFSTYPASKFNTPVLSKTIINNKVILSGEINIKKTKIYNDIVEIKPGTNFFIENGSSIIFKNKIIALGTKEKPITFKKTELKEWGVVALQGSHTTNSILDNIVFDGGSGAIYRNIKYTGALSIHDTKNITISNITMKNNSKYDDMIHIVYVDNIQLKNIHIKDSFMDAIDIDMSSDVKIKNVKINNSGNDGIDLMESDIIISDVKILNSGDKGISVGENSFLILNNSLLSNNDIGIATKDKSFSFILNTDIVHNNISLSNYKKNLQYADGGITKVYKSKLSNNKKILVDKHSTIKLINSNKDNINIKNKIMFNKKNTKHLLTLKNNNEKIIEKLKSNNLKIDVGNDYIGLKN